jgi:hypothetical protein
MTMAAAVTHGNMISAEDLIAELNKIASRMRSKGNDRMEVAARELVTGLEVRQSSHGRITVYGLALFMVNRAKR